jgi:hypothetical protein
VEDSSRRSRVLNERSDEKPKPRTANSSPSLSDLGLVLVSLPMEGFNLCLPIVLTMLIITLAEAYYFDSRNGFVKGRHGWRGPVGTRYIVMDKNGGDYILY